VLKRLDIHEAVSVPIDRQNTESVKAVPMDANKGTD
jgi:hypothetical protein